MKLFWLNEDNTCKLIVFVYLKPNSLLLHLIYEDFKFAKFGIKMLGSYGLWAEKAIYSPAVTMRTSFIILSPFLSGKEF